MVLPQFHIQHENFFEMVHPTSINLPSPYHWKHIDGFTRDIQHHVKNQEVGPRTELVISDQAQQETMKNGGKE